MWTNLLSNYTESDYIRFADQYSDSDVLLVGYSAFIYNGLTTFYSKCLSISTLEPSMSGIDSGYVSLVFNPWGSNTSYACSRFGNTKHLFLPTAERALCEGIQLREFIDEGLLVESLQSYLYSHDWNATALREMSIRYHIHDLDYWVQEAREWETA